MVVKEVLQRQEQGQALLEESCYLVVVQEVLQGQALPEGVMFLVWQRRSLQGRAAAGQGRLPSHAAAALLR